MGKYIGNQAPYGTFQKQALTPDDVTTTFTLDFQVGSVGSILVVYGGVLQEPGESYTLGSGGQQIVFSFAPETSQSLYIVYMGRELSVPDTGGPTSFVSYSPIITTFGTMMYSNLTISASYLPENGGSLIHYRVNFNLDLTGGDNKIRISLPVNNDGNVNVVGNVSLSTGTEMETGILKWGGVGVIDIYRQFGVNYTNDTWFCEMTVEYVAA